jgi:hypothetical protein
MALTTRNIVKMCQETKLKDLVRDSSSLLLIFPIYIFWPTTPWKNAPTKATEAPVIKNQ